MSKEKFLKLLITVLDSATYNWTLYEDNSGEVSVEDLLELISIYSEESEE